MKARSCPPISGPSPCSLAMNKDSHEISKFKPKIRIIHVFAPEIIQTDAANFRNLVQRLTGKPAADFRGRKKKRSMRSKDVLKTLIHHESSKTMELPEEFPCLKNGERVKQEQEKMWRDENSNGFFGGFADLDGFMQELSQFPLLPFESSRMDVFQKMPLA